MNEVTEKNKMPLSQKFKNTVKFFRKKPVWIASVVMLLLLVLVIGYFMIPKEPEIVDTRYLLGVITESSELTTAKINFTGKEEYKDAGVAFINKSDFIMMYDAEARVGIDVEKVKITSDDIKKIIFVEIPAVEVFDVHIKPDTIEYFDEKFSLFNFNKKEDANAAQAMAEEQARKELNEMGFIPLAETQAETLIKGILVNVIPRGYTIEVKK